MPSAPPMRRMFQAPRFTLPGLALALALLTSAISLPGQWQYIGPSLPVIRLWADPDSQNRLQMADVPYDVLREADALLPREASVLLVTSGRDVRHHEYTTFHRALYVLAPRTVWWLAPAPPDGTWESRWWIYGPLTPESIRDIADAAGASYVLSHDLRFAQPMPIGQRIREWRDGYLVRLDEREISGPGVGAGARLVPAGPAYAGPFWPLQVAAALAVILLFGYAALGVVARLGHRAYGLEAAALAWALGAGLTSLAMLGLNALNLSLNWQTIALTVCAAGGLAWSLTRKLREGKWLALPGRLRVARPVRRLTPPLAARSRATDMLLLGFFGLQIVAVTLLAVGRPLATWDSWVTWGMKARVIFRDGHISPAVYLDRSRAVTHLDYPLLVPLVEAWLYGWLGAPDDRLAGVPSVLFYLALAGVCYSAARRRGAGRTIALGAAVLAASIPRVALWAGLVFADVPLAVFATIAAIYLAEWLEGGPPGTLAIAALAAGLMPWTKREGAVLVAALCVAALVVCRGGLLAAPTRRAWLGAGGIAFAAVLLAGPWWAFIAYNRVANNDFLPMSVATFQANLGRLPAIARMALTSLLSANWSLVWPLAAFVGARGLVVRWRDGRSAHRGQAVGLLPMTAILYLGLMSLAFMFSAYVPYQQHVASSLERLIVHVVAMPALWLAYRRA